MSVATETEAKVRLEIVITDEQRDRFECAAGIEGLPLEAFVIAALEVHAENVILGPQEPMRALSPRAYVQLMDAIDNPAEPSEELRARYRRYLQRLDE
jgi:uncharacterized protein (DUF1778 family)